MALRNHLVSFRPREQRKDKRGQLQWMPSDQEIKVRIGISGDRASRAEVAGDVEIETYWARFPLNTKGVGIGARLFWDDSDWDISTPAFIRKTRSRATSHLTAQIRRRPHTEVKRD